jgi:hypothetical protein
MKVHWTADSAARLPMRHATADVELKLVGAVGIEPTTFGLKGRCSTTELRPYGPLRTTSEDERERTDGTAQVSSGI